eukprot:Seg394.1 transcript_id=Seg394.1/GoldUCD/mRNA.D3Y31 product="Coiled-coil domain-containing protein 134" protein_id=Seg394.1/GoldUCD/D3Y31
MRRSNRVCPNDFSRICCNRDPFEMVLKELHFTNIVCLVLSLACFALLQTHLYFCENLESSSETESGAKRDESFVNKDNNRNISLSKRDIYYAGFQIKRTHQLAAVKQLLTMQDYSKQYKMVELLTKKIFQVLSTSKVEIIESHYIPGHEFPEQDKELNALAHVVENTAFFGDILLRFPGMTHKIIKSNKEWQIIINWSVGFCNETGLFDGANEKLLSLVAQELNLIPRDPSYVNPYKAETLLKEAKKMQESSDSSKNKKKNKSKRKGRKGPRLSRTDL